MFGGQVTEVWWRCCKKNHRVQQATYCSHEVPNAPHWGAHNHTEVFNGFQMQYHWCAWECPGVALTPIHEKAGERSSKHLPLFNAEEERCHSKEKRTIYCKVVEWLLPTFATEGTIAETDAEMTTPNHSTNMNLVGYSQSLWSKALKCGSE